MSEMEDMLYLTEAQARSLREQLGELDLIPGVILWVRENSGGVLTIASDGWPETVYIHPDGRVENDDD